MRIENVYLSPRGAATYRLKGEAHSLTTDALTGDALPRELEASDGRVRLRWAVYSAGDARVAMSIELVNECECDIYVDSLSPLLLTGAEGLRVADVPLRRWMFMRQGRHKNQLPSVCCLGSRDEAYTDAQTSLSETGGGSNAVDAGECFTSDQLSVLSVPGTASLTLGFATGRDHLVDMLLAVRQFELERLECRSLAGVTLGAGSSMRSELLVLDADVDANAAIRRFARDKAQRYGARSGAVPPSVYCTWYYYGITVTLDDVRENLKALRERRIPFDVFQIDEGWAMSEGAWQPNDKFPISMRELAAEIAAAGYRPGIWTSPFIVTQQSLLASRHSDWLLKRRDGENCIFEMGTPYYVLDLTHPEVLEWLEGLYRMLTREWGYSYHKLDFTRAAVVQTDAVYHDPSVPLARAYYRAMAAIRRGAGEDAYILVCGGLYDPVIGVVDAQRSGSDVLSAWSRHITGGGREAPFTMKQVLLRTFMNEWWHTDPDALMVRRREQRERNLHLTLGLLNDDEAFTLALVQYLSGGLVCSTEPIAQIDPDRLYLYRHIMPVVRVDTMVMDAFSGARYPSIVDVMVDGHHTVALINWDDAARDMEFVLDEGMVRGLDCAAKYALAEFNTGWRRMDMRRGDRAMFRARPAHSALLVRVEARDDARPQLIWSDGHFSMGGEVRRLKMAGDAVRFGVDWRYPVEAHYLLRCPADYIFEESGARELRVAITERDCERMLPLLRAEA